MSSSWFKTHLLFTTPVSVTQKRKSYNERQKERKCFKARKVPFRDLPDSLSMRSESFSELGESGKLFGPSFASNILSSAGSNRLFICGAKFSWGSKKASLPNRCGLTSVSSGEESIEAGERGLQSGVCGAEGVEQYSDSLEHSSGRLGIVSILRPFKLR